MKFQDVCENKFLLYIVTLLRLVILLPYKCVVSLFDSDNYRKFIDKSLADSRTIN